MQLASLVEDYWAPFQEQYAAQLLPSHRHALDAIGRCRTPAAGELVLRCSACAEPLCQPRSCGHRSCPQCQNDDASRWLDRPQAKLRWRISG